MKEEPTPLVRKHPGLATSQFSNSQCEPCPPASVMSKFCPQNHGRMVHENCTFQSSSSTIHSAWSPGSPKAVKHIENMATLLEHLQVKCFPHTQELQMAKSNPNHSSSSVIFFKFLAAMQLIMFLWHWIKHRWICTVAPQMPKWICALCTFIF